MYHKMALLTGNADPEFTSYSFNNLENLCEVQTKKGFFYKKAKLLHPGEDLCCLALLDDRTRFVIINVGGIKYKVPWTTLENCPLTRLGKLKSCSNYDEIMNICDDYDVSCNEFFFDRNPSAFRTIMTFLTAGKLRLLREMCALSFQEELVYWGIEEDHLEWCCKKRLRQKEEEAAEARLYEGEMVFSETTQCAFQDNSRLSLCMRKLRDMVENPHSGIPGKIFACISISFVAITAVSLCISTMPDVREEEDRVSAAFLRVKCVCIVVSSGKVMGKIPPAIMQVSHSVFMMWRADWGRAQKALCHLIQRQTGPNSALPSQICQFTPADSFTQQIWFMTSLTRRQTSCCGHKNQPCLRLNVLKLG